MEWYEVLMILNGYWYEYGYGIGIGIRMIDNLKRNLKNDKKLVYYILNLLPF